MQILADVVILVISNRTCKMKLPIKFRLQIFKFKLVYQGKILEVTINGWTPQFIVLFYLQITRNIGSSHRGVITVIKE